MVDFNPIPLTQQTRTQKMMESVNKAPIRFQLDGNSYTVKPSVLNSAVPSKMDLGRNLKASVMSNGQLGGAESRTLTPVEISISGQKGKSEGFIDGAGMLYVKVGDASADPGEGGIQVTDREFGTGKDIVVGNYRLVGQVPTEEVNEAMTDASSFVDRYEASSRREAVQSGADRLTAEGQEKEKTNAEQTARANRRPGLVDAILEGWEGIKSLFRSRV